MSGLFEFTRWSSSSALLATSALPSPFPVLLLFLNVLEASSRGRNRLVRNRPLNTLDEAVVATVSVFAGHRFSLNCLEPSPTDLGDTRYGEEPDDRKFEGVKGSDSPYDSVLLISRYGGFPCIFSGERRLSLSFGRVFISQNRFFLEVQVNDNTIN
jgi:hypothetical protein